MITSRNHGLNKSAIFNQTEFDDFINLYLIQEKTFQQTIEIKLRKNSNFTTNIIEKALTRKIRQFILTIIEDYLYSANKIDSLIMYDHDSQILFRPMIRILDIIKPQNKKSFIECLKAMKIEGYYQTYQRNFHNVTSQDKLQIYNSFVNFAKQNQLFQKVIKYKKDPTQDKAPHLDINKVFNPRDQQLIYKLFSNCNFNVDDLIKQIKKYNLNIKDQDIQISDEQLLGKIENMLMIGLYEVYRLIVKIEKIRQIRWEIFSEKQILNQEFQPYYYMFARVAIRKDPKPFQARKIGPLIGRRVVMGKQHKTEQLRYCALYRHIKKHIVMKRIKKQMKSIIQKYGTKKYIILSANINQSQINQQEDSLSNNNTLSLINKSKRSKKNTNMPISPFYSVSMNDLDQYEGYNSIFDSSSSMFPINKKQRKPRKKKQTVKTHKIKKTV